MVHTARQAQAFSQKHARIVKDLCAHVVDEGVDHSGDTVRWQQGSFFHPVLVGEGHLPILGKVHKLAANLWSVAVDGLLLVRRLLNVDKVGCDVAVEEFQSRIGSRLFQQLVPLLKIYSADG